MAILPLALPKRLRRPADMLAATYYLCLGTKVCVAFGDEKEAILRPAAEQAAGTGARRSMTYYQQQVLALQARLYPQPEVANRLRRARQLINQHFADPLDLSQLAAAACYSPFHFLRQFKRYYGCTPHEYLRAVRLAQATRVLAAGQSARQACFSAGFDSVSSFTTLFRQWSGCTPTAFRQRHQHSNFGEVVESSLAVICRPKQAL